jgi:hypothetical protein
MLHSLTGIRRNSNEGIIIMAKLDISSESAFSFFAPPVTKSKTPKNETSKTYASNLDRGNLYNTYEVRETSKGARFCTKDTKTNGKYFMD